MITEDHFCYPDKLRRTVRRESDGMVVLLSVVNGDTMWYGSPGKKRKAKEVNGQKIARPSLIAMIDNLMFVRDSVDPAIVHAPRLVDGDKQIAITVSSDARMSSTTYFDASTYLVLKETKDYLPDMTGAKIDLKRKAVSETIYSRYKDFDGVILPTHIVASQGGKKVFEINILDVQFLKEIDLMLFEKPWDD